MKVKVKRIPPVLIFSNMQSQYYYCMHVSHLLCKVLVVSMHDLPAAGSSMNTGMVIIIFCINIITYKK